MWKQHSEHRWGRAAQAYSTSFHKPCSYNHPSGCTQICRCSSTAGHPDADLRSQTSWARSGCWGRQRSTQACRVQASTSGSGGSEGQGQAFCPAQGARACDVRIMPAGAGGGGGGGAPCRFADRQPDGGCSPCTGLQGHEPGELARVDGERDVRAGLTCAVLADALHSHPPGRRLHPLVCAPNTPRVPQPASPGLDASVKGP